MPGKEKRRPYDVAGRRAKAEATRHAILEAARARFLQSGYAGTTMAAIAKDAGTSLDTVYEAVGKKPALFRHLVETAISGQDDAVPAQERDYVKKMRAEPDAARKLQIYAAALASIQPRLAPLFRVLQTAAPMDGELNAMWQQISQRRAANMRLLAAELKATGQMREDLSVEMAADIIWSMNSAEYYLLLVEQRGWPQEAFEWWLGNAWQRLLLKG